jgi:cellulose synthase/poly-beta-1,6-N-acetylglucosamine synthase-like glycosyltransferase
MYFLLLVLSLIVISLFFIIQWFSLAVIFFTPKKNTQKFDQWPKVSILLAARNESQTVERCLKALYELDYPKENLEVLIGNDSSEDNTKEMVLAIIKHWPNFKLFDIHQQLGKALGKANVLANLAHKANGDYYFITDCDVAVPKGWIKSLLACFTPEVGIASGTTTCKTGLWSANLQAIDWLHFMGYIKAFANVGVSCTSVGNNMVVRAEAYWQTGGYENIDFSITEDYKLFKEVTSNQWQWRNILSPESLGLATPIKSFIEILHQRKRWLMGANELPWNWKLLIAIYGLFFPALMVLAFTYPWLSLILWGIKFTVQSIFISILNNKSKAQLNFSIPIFFYELYVLGMTLLTMIFYFLPIKSIWKGRKYTSKGLFNSMKP